MSQTHPPATVHKSVKVYSSPSYSDTPDSMDSCNFMTFTNCSLVNTFFEVSALLMIRFWNRDVDGKYSKNCCAINEG